MKIEPMKNLESWRRWAVGLHIHTGTFTLVALIGTAWHFGFNRTPNAFGFCFGPLTIGGAK